MNNQDHPQELEAQIMKFMGKSEIMEKIQDMLNNKRKRL